MECGLGFILPVLTDVVGVTVDFGFGLYSRLAVARAILFSTFLLRRTVTSARRQCVRPSNGGHSLHARPTQEMRDIAAGMFAASSKRHVVAVQLVASFFLTACLVGVRLGIFSWHSLIT